jgi:tRNA(fMet)-specific endonuclease VapC
MIYLLDTDILTLAQHGQRAVADRIAAVKPSDTVAVPVVTQSQVFKGRIATLLSAPDGTAAARAATAFCAVDEYIRRYPLILFDAAAGTHFDRLRAARQAKTVSWKGDLGDFLNACIALAHAATLVTRNTKDFAGIPGLKLENWAD